MNKNIFTWFIGILIVTLMISLSWYFYLESRITTYSANNTPTAALESQNKNYAEAISYEKAKKYDRALLSYQKSLPEAQDKIQATQIRLKIATMNEWIGNYAEAITQFKAIAADITNYAIARAYAVQEIGFMNVYTENDAHKTVLTETFKDSPYDSFKKDSNLNMAYVKLFEYAANIYPLGYSEAYIAYGYSGEILNTLHRATTTPLGVEYLSIIKQSLEAADTDIKRMKEVPGETGLVPVALVWQGVALSRLASMGVVDPQQAEHYLKNGVAYGTILGDRPGSFNTFNYAAYLVYHYGNTRSDDIKRLLLPFRVDNDAQIYPQVVNFYKVARTDKVLSGDKKQIVFMGKMDLNFKKYLISLGWKDSDF